MINKIKLHFIVFLVPFFSISQTDSTKPTIKLPEPDQTYNGFLTFGLGRSIPKGELASQNVKSDSAGLAFNGLDLRVSFGYLFHKNIGLCLTYFNQSFNINTKAIEDHLAKMYPSSSFSVAVASGWKLKGTMLGIYGKVAIDEGKKVFLEPRVMIGLASGYSPEYSITEYIKVTSGTTPYLTGNQSSGKCDPIVTYAFGGTLRAELGKRFCAGINVDYTSLLQYTHYDNINITYKTNVGPGIPPETTSFKQEMRSLAISGSIGFRFGRRKLFDQ